MSNPAWYDLEMRGRKLEALSKRMVTEFHKALNDNKIDLALSYMDRIVKIEAVIKPYVEQVTGLRKFLKEHESNQIPILP